MWRTPWPPWRSGSRNRRQEVKANPLLLRGAFWTGAALTALAALLVGAAAVLDGGYFREGLVRVAASRARRDIQVAGALHTHLLSLHPSVVAERVTLGNPAWMPAGQTAQIGRLTIEFEWPGFTHRSSIRRLALESAVLQLKRDADGRANWQRVDPTKKAASRLPLIRDLSVPAAQVSLDDARLHLKFDGVVTVEGASEHGRPSPLRVEGKGQLNERAMTFALLSDPLMTAARNRPYGFSFTESSGRGKAEGHGALASAFDFDASDTTVAASGGNLKDMYFLAGVTLINTGAFTLSGSIERRGVVTNFNDLAVKFGSSDVRGTVQVDSSQPRSRIHIRLDSQYLLTTDVGARAAGLLSEAELASPKLFSNAAFNPSAMRRSEIVAEFHAKRVDIGRTSLQQVAAKLSVDQGHITVSPITASVLEGKLDGRAKIDATRDVPPTEVDLTLTDIQVGKIPRKSNAPAPLEGPLDMHVHLIGHGASMHEVAATAQGSVTLTMPHGTLRDSLAELTGIDLRGLGLLLTKNTKDTLVRCGVARFKAQGGQLSSDDLVLDTEQVLITGDGMINLDTESLDLAFSGHPKSTRLFRVQAPVVVQGTILQPTVGVRGKHATLLLVDNGHAKDVDCQAVSRQ